MQNDGHYGPGTANQVQQQPAAAPPQQQQQPQYHPLPSEPSPTGSSNGSTTSLRQFRKKDVEKGSESLGAQKLEARVAPHSHYPPSHQSADYRYPLMGHHQYQDYSPGPQPKYDLNENHHGQNSPISTSVIQKPKHMEICQQPSGHLKQSYPHQLGPSSHHQGYGVDNSQLLQSPTQMPSSAYKSAESQYYSKEQYHHQMSGHHAQKYHQMMPPQNLRKFQNSGDETFMTKPDSFLSKLSKLNPNMARSIMNEHHLQESIGGQPPTYPGMDQRMLYQNNQRYYSGAIHPSQMGYPSNNYPPISYPNYAPCNYNRNANMAAAPPTRYNPQLDQDNSPSRRPYSDNLHHMAMCATLTQKLQNYPSQYNPPPEYAQHYRHRRDAMGQVIPQEYYQQTTGYGRPPQYMGGHQIPAPQGLPDVVEAGPVSLSDNLKKFVENWMDEEEITGDITNNLDNGTVNVGDQIIQVSMVNPSDVPFLENRGIPVVTPENGHLSLTQYLIKTGIDPQMVKIIEASNKESIINENGTQEKVVSLHIVDQPKTDCMLTNHTQTLETAEHKKVVVHQNKIIQPCSNVSSVLTSDFVERIPNINQNLENIGVCQPNNATRIHTKDLVDKNCSPINLTEINENLNNKDIAEARDSCIKSVQTKPDESCSSDESRSPTGSFKSMPIIDSFDNEINAVKINQNPFNSNKKIIKNATRIDDSYQDLDQEAQKLVDSICDESKDTNGIQNNLSPNSKAAEVTVDTPTIIHKITEEKYSESALDLSDYTPNESTSLAHKTDLNISKTIQSRKEHSLENVSIDFSNANLNKAIENNNSLSDSSKEILFPTDSEISRSTTPKSSTLSTPRSSPVLIENPNFERGNSPVVQDESNAQPVRINYKRKRILSIEDIIYPKSTKENEKLTLFHKTMVFINREKEFSSMEQNDLVKFTDIIKTGEKMCITTNLDFNDDFVNKSKQHDKAISIRPNSRKRRAHSEPLSDEALQKNVTDLTNQNLDFLRQKKLVTVAVNTDFVEHAAFELTDKVIENGKIEDDKTDQEESLENNAILVINEDRNIVSSSYNNNISALSKLQAAIFNNDAVDQKFVCIDKMPICLNLEGTGIKIKIGKVNGKIIIKTEQAQKRLEVDINDNYNICSISENYIKSDTSLCRNEDKITKPNIQYESNQKNNISLGNAENKSNNIEISISTKTVDTISNKKTGDDLYFTKTNEYLNDSVEIENSSTAKIPFSNTQTNSGNLESNLSEKMQVEKIDIQESILSDKKEFILDQQENKSLSENEDINQNKYEKVCHQEFSLDTKPDRKLQSKDSADKLHFNVSCEGKSFLIQENVKYESGTTNIIENCPEESPNKVTSEHIKKWFERLNAGINIQKSLNSDTVDQMSTETETLHDASQEMATQYSALIIAQNKIEQVCVSPIVKSDQDLKESLKTDTTLCVTYDKLYMKNKIKDAKKISQERTLTDNGSTNDKSTPESKAKHAEKVKKLNRNKRKTGSNKFQPEADTQNKDTIVNVKKITENEMSNNIPGNKNQELQGLLKTVEVDVKLSEGNIINKNIHETVPIVKNITETTNENKKDLGNTDGFNLEYNVLPQENVTNVNKTPVALPENDNTHKPTLPTKLQDAENYKLNLARDVLTSENMLVDKIQKINSVDKLTVQTITQNIKTNPEVYKNKIFCSMKNNYINENSVSLRENNNTSKIDIQPKPREKTTKQDNDLVEKHSVTLPENNDTIKIFTRHKKEEVFNKPLKENALSSNNILFGESSETLSENANLNEIIKHPKTQEKSANQNNNLLEQSSEPLPPENDVTIKVSTEPQKEVPDILLEENVFSPKNISFCESTEMLLEHTNPNKIIIQPEIRDKTTNENNNLCNKTSVNLPENDDTIKIFIKQEKEKVHAMFLNENALSPEKNLTDESSQSLSENSEPNKIIVLPKKQEKSTNQSNYLIQQSSKILPENEKVYYMPLEENALSPKSILISKSFETLSENANLNGVFIQPEKLDITTNKNNEDQEKRKVFDIPLEENAVSPKNILIGESSETISEITNLANQNSNLFKKTSISPPENDDTIKISTEHGKEAVYGMPIESLKNMAVNQSSETLSGNTELNENITQQSTNEKETRKIALENNKISTKNITINEKFVNEQDNHITNQDIPKKEMDKNPLESDVFSHINNLSDKGSNTPTHLFRATHELVKHNETQNQETKETFSKNDIFTPENLLTNESSVTFPENENTGEEKAPTLSPQVNLISSEITLLEIFEEVTCSDSEKMLVEEEIIFEELESTAEEQQYLQSDEIRNKEEIEPDFSEEPQSEYFLEDSEDTLIQLPSEISELPQDIIDCPIEEYPHEILVDDPLEVGLVEEIGRVSSSPDHILEIEPLKGLEVRIKATEEKLEESDYTADSSDDIQLLDDMKIENQKYIPDKEISEKPKPSKSILFSQENRLCSIPAPFIKSRDVMILSPTSTNNEDTALPTFEGGIIYKRRESNECVPICSAPLTKAAKKQYDCDLQSTAISTTSAISERCMFREESNINSIQKQYNKPQECFKEVQVNLERLDTEQLKSKLSKVKRIGEEDKKDTKSLNSNVREIILDAKRTKKPQNKIYKLNPKKNKNLVKKKERETDTIKPIIVNEIKTKKLKNLKRSKRIDQKIKSRSLQKEWLKKLVAKRKAKCKNAPQNKPPEVENIENKSKESVNPKNKGDEDDDFADFNELVKRHKEKKKKIQELKLKTEQQSAKIDRDKVVMPVVKTNFEFKTKDNKNKTHKPDVSNADLTKPKKEQKQIMQMETSAEKKIINLKLANKVPETKTGEVKPSVVSQTKVKTLEEQAKTLIEAKSHIKTSRPKKVRHIRKPELIEEEKDEACDKRLDIEEGEIEHSPVNETNVNVNLLNIPKCKDILSLPLINPTEFSTKTSLNQKPDSKPNMPIMVPSVSEFMDENKSISKRKITLQDYKKKRKIDNVTSSSGTDSKSENDSPAFAHKKTKIDEHNIRKNENLAKSLSFEENVPTSVENNIIRFETIPPRRKSVDFSTVQVISDRMTVEYSLQGKHSPDGERQARVDPRIKIRKKSIEVPSKTEPVQSYFTSPNVEERATKVQQDSNEGRVRLDQVSFHKKQSLKRVDDVSERKGRSPKRLRRKSVETSLYPPETEVKDILSHDETNKILLRSSNEWEDSNSPKHETATDAESLNVNFSGLIIKNPKPIIDVDELKLTVDPNYSGDHEENENPIPETSIEQYRERIDSELSSLNINIPKSSREPVNNYPTFNIEDIKRPLESNALVQKFMVNERMTDAEMEIIKKIISYKKIIYHNRKNPSDNLSILSGNSQRYELKNSGEDRMKLHFKRLGSFKRKPDCTNWEERIPKTFSQYCTENKNAHCSTKQNKLSNELGQRDRNLEEEPSCSKNEHQPRLNDYSVQMQYSSQEKNKLPKIIFKRTKTSEEPVVVLERLEVETVREKYNLSVNGVSCD